MSSYCGGGIDMAWHMVDMRKIGRNEFDHFKFSSLENWEIGGVLK